jgi:nucleoid-associated protein YgaU
MDYEYDTEEEYAPRVMWGRVAFFLIVLLSVFLLGRCTNRGGASEADLVAERTRVAELQSEKELLEQQLDAAQNGGGDGGDGEAEGDGETEGDGGETAEDGDGSAEGQDGVAEGGETYTVQSGDTLTRIAEQFYGDPRKFNLIAEANNIESGDLRVGQELTIPPDE